LSAPTLTRNHFFPLYSFERDAERQARKFGLLGFGKASLYFHQDGPESVSDRLFPLYFYDRPHADELHVSVLGLAPVALYQHHAMADEERDRLFPLYDYARKGEDRTLSLLGVNQVALYRQEISPARLRHRLFPLYRYSHDYVKDETDFNALFIYRHVASQSRVIDQLLPIWDYTSDRDRAWDLGLVGITPITLYRHQTNAWSSAGHFFPLYGYRSSESEGRKVSLLGFPPTRHRFTWAFYEHVSSASLTSDRFFPLYKYSHNKTASEYEWNVLLLYRHQGWDTGAKDMLLPIHQFAYDEKKNTWQLSLLGVAPFTLYRYWTSPDETTGHFFPLYGYRRMNDIRRWSLVGLPPIGSWPAFSLYEHAVKGSQTTDRFFPLYFYAHDDLRDEISFSALFLYWHKSTPTMDQNSLFPLLSVRRDEAEKEWRVSAIGLDPFVPVSLFHQSVGEDMTSSRLFPSASTSLRSTGTRRTPRRLATGYSHCGDISTMLQAGKRDSAYSVFRRYLYICMTRAPKKHRTGCSPSINIRQITKQARPSSRFSGLFLITKARTGRPQRPVCFGGYLATTGPIVRVGKYPFWGFLPQRWS
jgi:hypothetical protein